jgi:hypothetical protein
LSKVLLFSTSTCSWCRRAKRYFKERGVPFKEIDIERDADGALRKTLQFTQPSSVLATLYPCTRADAAGTLVLPISCLDADCDNATCDREKGRGVVGPGPRVCFPGSRVLSPSVASPRLPGGCPQPLSRCL